MCPDWYVWCDSKGYGGSDGPGSGQDGNAASGGGHGGFGGNSSIGKLGGDAYGDYGRPTTLGSGRAKDIDNRIDGGRGGGVIRLRVGGTLSNDGYIVARGDYSTAGGGSGGSIWLTAGSIQGAGLVLADGGGCKRDYGSGGGAGGRIAIYTCDNQLSYDRISARGGCGWSCGEDGSVFVPSDGFAILDDPSSQPAKRGQTISFAVDVEGYGPFAYEWFKDGKRLADGGRVSGASTATITIKSVERNEP